MTVVMPQRIRTYSQHIEKRYHRSELLIDSHLLNQRLQAICEASQTHNNIPEIRTQWDGETLIVRQQRVRSVVFPSDNHEICTKIFERLAAVLDRLPENLIHGDINCKNVLYDGTNLQLIDWEPALLQKRLWQEAMMYTEPYISQRDRNQQKLSKETDKIGFFYTILRLLHKQPRITSPYRIVVDCKRGKCQLTPEPEQQFLQRTFAEVLLLAFENPKWQPKVFDGETMAGYEIIE